MGTLGLLAIPSTVMEHCCRFPFSMDRRGSAGMTLQSWLLCVTPRSWSAEARNRCCCVSDTATLPRLCDLDALCEPVRALPGHKRTFLARTRGLVVQQTEGDLACCTQMSSQACYSGQHETSHRAASLHLASGTSLCGPHCCCATCRLHVVPHASPGCCHYPD